MQKLTVMSSNVRNYFLIGGLALLLLQLLPEAASFTLNPPQIRSQKKILCESSSLFGMYSQGRSSSRSGKERSKRQFRVNQLVQTELGKIIHTGLIKGDAEYLEDELRQRISIVSVDVSPDLRQARVSTSVRSSSNADTNMAVDKRRAYSWLVENSRPLRHSLAQKMSHMKTSPSLSFVQVDVAAAVGKLLT
jgi:ribosome-binding factor A